MKLFGFGSVNVIDGETHVLLCMPTPSTFWWRTVLQKNSFSRLNPQFLLYSTNSLIETRLLWDSSSWPSPMTSRRLRLRLANGGVPLPGFLATDVRRDWIGLNRNGDIPYFPRGSINHQWNFHRTAIIYIICMYISPYHHLPWGNLIYGTWLMDIKWYRAL